MNRKSSWKAAEKSEINCNRKKIQSYKVEMEKNL